MAAVPKKPYYNLKKRALAYRTSNQAAITAAINLCCAASPGEELTKILH
jgi:hypothetical protein